VTRASRRNIEEGNRRLVRLSFTRVSSPICIRPTRKGGSWSSGSSAGNGGEGLPTMSASGSPSTLRETGEAREREQRLRVLSCGRGSIARKGCARASAQFRTRELGTARKRAGIVAEVVRRRLGPEKRRAHHSTELVPRRDRGPSPRAKTAWRHVARSRGERLFSQGQRPRKGTNCLREAGVRIGVVFVGPRRQSRGINEWSVGSSRLGNEARRGRGGLPNEGRHLGS